MVKLIIIDTKNLTGVGISLRGDTKANAALRANLFDLIAGHESLMHLHETSIAEHPALYRSWAILICPSIVMPPLSKS